MADGKPPFDMVRAGFYLVAFVFVVYALAALAAEAGCFMLPATKGCGEGKLAEVFGTLLASALAYSAGKGKSVV